MTATDDRLAPAWLAALESPAAYRHGVERVERIDTHISWVFLAGEFAYKLKKPVALGFLDFSTIDRRLAACREEVRINRRTAPAIYLDVVPLRQSAAGPKFDAAADSPGEGAILDWAVRMRRFDVAETLDRRLADGRIDMATIDRVARRVAALHRSADRATVDGPFGRPERVRHFVDECLETLLRAPLGTIRRDGAEDARRWFDAQAAQWSAAVDRRRREGLVRECHGDLHLGNLVAHDGEPTLFDAIEFNAALRWIDVASDIAFLTMDLSDRGRDDLAWTALDAWLDETGDFAALTVLRPYSVYRALVRAKVAELQAGQTGDREIASRLRSKADHYVAWATRATAPGAPKMILMHGVSGSGKSWVGRKIAERMGAVRVRSDVERKRLVGAWPDLEHDGAEPAKRETLYSAEHSERTYRRLHGIAETALTSGWSIVVDATFLRAEQRAPFWELGRRLGAATLVVACEAPVEELRRRIRARSASGGDPSDADEAVLASQLRQLERPSLTEGKVVAANSPESLENVHDEVASLAPRRM